MIFQSNDDARKAMFARFNAFQDEFFSMLAAYTKAADQKEQSAIATRFVKDVVIPYLDSAKELVLGEFMQPLQAITAELSKLLQVFGEAST